MSIPGAMRNNLSVSVPSNLITYIFSVLVCKSASVVKRPTMKHSIIRCLMNCLLIRDSHLKSASAKRISDSNTVNDLISSDALTATLSSLLFVTFLRGSSLAVTGTPSASSPIRLKVFSAILPKDKKLLRIEVEVLMLLKSGKWKPSVLSIELWASGNSAMSDANREKCWDEK